MALIKKNIWFLFYILIGFSTFFLIITSYFRWDNVRDGYRLKQENIIKILSNTTHSLFKSQELVLDVIGSRFFEDETYKDFDKVRIPLEQLTKANPSIIAFGLADTNGQLIFISSQRNTSNLPNLKKQKQSRDSFMETLSSNNMVLGRTYYFKPLKQYVVPIRKAIRNENGKVVSVMTAALNIEDAFGKIRQEIDYEDDFLFSLIRGNDLHIQYRSHKLENGNIYNEPVPVDVLENIYKKVFEKYALSVDQLKNEEKIISFIAKDKYNENLLTSLRYDKTYNQWIVIQNKMKDIYYKFIESLTIYISIFIAVLAVIFYFVRIISNADKKRNAALVHQATYDDISKLPNRNYLKYHTDEWFDELVKPFSILNIDMDKFKNVNDTLGHESGDKILQEIANRLQACMPKKTLIVRYGGDEFIIFIKETKNENLLNYANNILNTLSEPYPVENFYFTLGASIGIAKFPQDGNTFDILMRASDIAMYEAKKSRNSISIFANDLQEGYLKNIQIEQALRNALKNKEFHMVYQPQFTNKNQLHGVESLIRWNSKTLGFIPPDQFISIAENTGMMGEIGRFIVETSLKEIQQVQKELNICFKLSINISLRQFMGKTFFTHLINTLKNTPLCAPTSLTLEVTESLFIDDIDYILPLLHSIKELGIEISMDDFGTGYSSLSVLKLLPIDELKIDKSFVDDILTDKMAKKMVKNIISIGKNLDMSVLAEGVETVEQKDLLTKLKCDRFQGYYFSKPLEKDKLLEFLKSNINNSMGIKS